MESIASILQNWIDELLISGKEKGTPPATGHFKTMRDKYPKPKDVEWIFCQEEACVIGKKRL